MVEPMNDTEKKIADMLLKDVTLVNVADRLRDYHALLECAEKRRGIEGSETFYRSLTPTGHAAIDNA